MSRPAIDITGQRFGMMVALYPTDQRYGAHVVWECLCDCGRLTQTAGGLLRAGKVRSCGCQRKHLRREVCRRGHPLTPDNVVLTRDLHRKCRTCAEAWEAAHRGGRRSYGAHWMAEVRGLARLHEALRGRSFSDFDGLLGGRRHWELV